MAFKMSGGLFSSVAFTALLETARDANGNLLTGGSGGGGGGGGGGSAGGGGLNIVYVCVSGTVNAGGFVSVDTICFNTLVP